MSAQTTPLLAQLRRKIRHDGPLSIAQYMNDCLLHPEHGYYTTQTPIGAGGDFTTAPEISQMFGELIGACLAQSWIDQGQPRRFTLAELGPGRGTLMADLLRATRAVRGFHDAAEIVLLEASPRLRATQAEALAGHAPRWIDKIADLPQQQPLFLVANEFFDALPVRQFERSGGDGWCERRVGLDAAGEELILGRSPAQGQPALAHRLADTREGDIVELCEGARDYVTAIAERIAGSGGMALIIDYGDWRSLGDTLQALRAHRPADPLRTPGLADLTTHVDFEPLAEATRAAGAAHTRLTPQGVFLERLGITTRARALAARLQPEAQPAAGADTSGALEQLIAAHRRLTHPEEMGNLFKVLGLYPADLSPPAGLEP